MPGISRKAAVALAASASLTPLATACTGQADSGASDDASKETTLNFWHAWSAPSEVKAVKDLVAGFEERHPGIHVNVVGNMTDDKINQALRTGGAKAPDVISSFAELDGATPWQRFRYVTLPNISPIVMFAVVTGVIQTMQYYTQPLIAGKVASGVIQGAGTQFEPGYPDKSTLTLPQLVYNLGFQRFDYGSACVAALVLFALSMAFTALLMRRKGGLIQAGDR